MVKRYYYDCAAEVTCMLKSFGMQFLSAAGNLIDIEAETIRDIRLVEEQMPSYWYPIDKAYIHPDSLPILEPKVGDLVEIIGGYNSGQFDHIDSLPDKPDALVELSYQSYAYMAFDFQLKNADKFKGFKTIQRDGKPFFWPKEESDG